MAKKNDNGQVKLRVVTTIDDTPGKEHINPDTGQAQLLGLTQHLLPPELKPFADFMNNRLSQTERKLDASTAQNQRLANSLEQVIPKFIDQSVNHTAPDIVFGQLSEGQDADVAIANGTNMPAESIYTLTASQLVNQIGNHTITAIRMGRLLRDLKIFGDAKYHHAFSTGLKGVSHKYKPSVIDEIYRRLSQPEQYGIHSDLTISYGNYIKPKGL